jgi:hypothetical protein
MDSTMRCNLAMPVFASISTKATSVHHGARGEGAAQQRGPRRSGVTMPASAAVFAPSEGSANALLAPFYVSINIGDVGSYCLLTLW